MYRMVCGHPNALEMGRENDHFFTMCLGPIMTPYALGNLKGLPRKGCVFSLKNHFYTQNSFQDTSMFQDTSRTLLYFQDNFQDTFILRRVSRTLLYSVLICFPQLKLLPTAGQSTRFST